ncbi:hypothetical protein HMPREF9120_01487 [Neisseria sp. oral taxon 020 str. F0370]|nr:hypothetical protein HMPREF9120_01487 [Neisseria sp. oral taxon 020 str. F0370]
MRLSTDAKGRLKSSNRFSDGLMFAFGFGNAQGSLKTRQPTSPRKPLHARQSRFKPAQNPARPD